MLSVGVDVNQGPSEEPCSTSTPSDGEPSSTTPTSDGEPSSTTPTTSDGEPSSTTPTSDGEPSSTTPTSDGEPSSTTTPSDGEPSTTTPATGDCPLAGFCQDFDAIVDIGNTVYAFKGAAVSHFPFSMALYMATSSLSRMASLVACRCCLQCSDCYLF